MKIGFLGNTNNYPFIIAKQMQALGCDVVLFVDALPEDMLHRPEHYSSDISYPYPSWIKENLSIGNTLYIHFPQFFLRKVIKELNTCDAVILNGVGHRFKNYIKKSIPSISMFSGGDLEIMADYENVLNMKYTSPKLNHLPRIVKRWYSIFSVNQLRSGIKAASLISYFPQGLIPNGDRILDEIFNNKRIDRFNHLHITTEGYRYIEPPGNSVLNVFSFTRFMWKEPFPPGRSKAENKGNDIMIRGIALFIKKYNRKIKVNLVEKGLHIEETKTLIDQLEIPDCITWHKEMPFKNLLQHIAKADIIFEQLGKHYISGGFYAMLVGRPVIGNARPEVFNNYIQEHSPVCHAATPEEVADWLLKLDDDRKLIKEIGIRSRDYILKYFDIQNETIYFKNFLTELIQKQQCSEA